MTGVTVEHLAETLNVSAEKLMEHLQKAGVTLKSAEALISNPQKDLLLAYMKENDIALAPKKITLKRKSVSEIKVTRSTGHKTTVSVVRKSRRIYVKQESAELVEQTEATPEVLVAPEPPPTAIEAPESLNNTLPANETAKPVEDLVKPNETSEPSLEEVPKNSVKTDAETASAELKKARSKDSAKEIEEEGNRNRAKSKKTTNVKNTPVDDWRKTKSKIAQTLLSPDESTDSEEDLPKPKPKPKLVKDKIKYDSYARRNVKTNSSNAKNKHAFAKPSGPIVREIEIAEQITVADLAQKMSIKAAEPIKVLMKMGIMATINQYIDLDTAVLVIEELGHAAKIIKVKDVEDSIKTVSTEVQSSRSPIVTVMGHVDHGKTSLLDYIRRTKVTNSEAGGITQHIGAYKVNTAKGTITFLDTPGHAAFTAMRARGVQCTDIVILVVAADDGVMPQTIEAVQHAIAGKVPLVVAINKIDKAGADLDRIYNELSQHGLVPEAWGGDAMFVPVSAKEGTGIEALLEAVLLQAEILELKAAFTGPAQGVVIESKLDKGRGPVATLLIQSGILKVGDIVLAGSEYGRVRAMLNETHQSIKQAEPSQPVEILGLSNTPLAGDEFIVVADERKAREIAAHRQANLREIRIARQQMVNLESFMDQVHSDDCKSLSIILKTDVQGSVDALKDALQALSTETIKVNVVTSGVGGISESDINLAMASKAIVIGFNVRADVSARRLADKEGIEITYYSVIYDIIDRIKSAINGLIGPQFKEKILGLALVREVFRSAKIGAVAGCMVTEGIIKRKCPIRVLRDNIVIYQGELESLRRFKDDLQEVRNGMECGIGVKNYNDVRIGDQIEVYETVQVQHEMA